MGDCPEYFGSVKFVRYFFQLIIEWVIRRGSALMTHASVCLLEGATVAHSLVYACSDNEDPLKVFKDPLKVFKDPLKVFKDPLKVFKDPLKVFSTKSRTFLEQSLSRSSALPAVNDRSSAHRRFSQAVSDFQWMSRIAHDAHHPRLSHRTPPWTIYNPRERVRTSRWRRFLPPNYSAR